MLDAYNENLRKAGKYMADYANFRQRLDNVLRTLDVKQVRGFLIAERQWSPAHLSILNLPCGWWRHNVVLFRLSV
jgi:adenylate cyclase